jgi:superfamily II DNA/RNA helicase
MGSLSPLTGLTGLCPLVVDTLVVVMLQVEDLARLSFKRQPLYVGIDDSKAASTREGLEQGYCCVASDKRFLLLFTFLKKNANKKVCTQSS